MKAGMVMVGGALAAAVFAGCRAEPRRPSADAPLEVFVGLPPYACLVERIGGRHVAVHVLLQPGGDPHSFALTPKQMAALGRARLFFKVGMPFEERFLERVSADQRRLTVVDLAEGVPRRAMEPAEHDGGENHAHGETQGPDPHVWLSPPLLKPQARNIAKALEDADPAHAAEYRDNLGALLSDLDQTDTRITAALKPYRGKTFYVFHPAFGYFADAYGLKQAAVEAGGRTPTVTQLRALIQQARAEKVKVIFVQPQFDRRSALTIAKAIGGSVVEIDPLATDVLKNLEEIAQALAGALGTDP